ncbi:MAG: zinc ABC transporter solute-binding protein [Candidatus Ruthia sp.]|nr:zinc ABC transporter solute-binding protein [Candidatus Ruthturnera sp.]MBT4668145.1 zinc ABC transporter solute-binding protein [Candidatus Ruthturnera sp.]
MSRIVLTLLFFFSLNAVANIKVVASIKPIHSIASAIIQGVDEVDLLLDLQQSAHHFHLKPSQISLLNKADLVIAINPNMEEGISKILTNLPKQKTLYVVDSEHDEHDESSINYHVWLDVSKMQLFAKKLTNKFISLDPKNKAVFNKNLQALELNLSKLDADIKVQLDQYKRTPIVSYSQALAPFLNANQLNLITSVVNNHEQRLSAKRILDARKAIKNNSVECLLSTVEIAPKRTRTVAEGFNIQNISIDIIGSNLNRGPNLYPKLMHNIANTVEHCLK